MNPPNGTEKVEYSINVTANVTDSADHTKSHEFFVHYIAKKDNSTTTQRISTLKPTTVINRRLIETKYVYSLIVKRTVLSSSCSEQKETL